MLHLLFLGSVFYCYDQSLTFPFTFCSGYSASGKNANNYGLQSGTPCIAAAYLNDKKTVFKHNSRYYPNGNKISTLPGLVVSSMTAILELSSTEFVFINGLVMKKYVYATTTDCGTLAITP